MNDGSVFVLATVEVKNPVSDNIISSVIWEQSAVPIIKVWDCEYLQQNIPRDILLQILHLCIVLGSNVGIYIWSSETGVTFTLIILFDDHIIKISTNALIDVVVSYVRWENCVELNITVYWAEEQVEQYG